MKTIAHEFLDIEAEDFEVPQSCYDTLESILEKSKERIDVESNPRKVLSSIGKLLKKEGFSYKKGTLLSKGLQTRKANCKAYSLLYYAIAEELQLPLNVISLPGHLAIRWNDGKNTFNWETTKPKKFDDEYYVSLFNIPKESVSKGVYLKNLTREEIKSIAFNDKGTIEFYRGNLDEAISDHTKAIKLNPNYAYAYYNRGTIRHKLKDLEGAISDCDKAIELYPHFEDAYNNRGLAKELNGDLKGAISDYDKALELNPNHVRAYSNRRIAKSKIERSQQSQELWRVHRKMPRIRK